MSQPERLTVRAIVSALPLLTQAERSQVSAALSILPKDERGSDEPEVLLWEQLQRVASSSEGLPPLPPVSRVKLTSAYAAYRRDALAAVSYLQELVEPRSKTELVQLLQLAAHALLTRIDKLRVAVGLEMTPVVVMRQVVNLPAAVSAAWPGGRDEICFVLRLQEGRSAT